MSTTLKINSDLVQNTVKSTMYSLALSNYVGVVPALGSGASGELVPSFASRKATMPIKVINKKKWAL